MVKPPSAKTLAKYGLSTFDWTMLLMSQGGVCAVCKKAPSTGRMYIDHEHVKGWSKMPAGERRRYVRGLLCYVDNRFFLAKGATIARMLRAAVYLRMYDNRKASV